MGAGGAAPPVRSEDVMILVGATILLTIFVVQAWSIPTNIGCSKDEDGKEECETYSVKYELSEGDIFTLEVVEGEVRPTVVLPDGSKSFENNQIQIQFFRMFRGSGYARAYYDCHVWKRTMECQPESCGCVREHLGLR